MSAASLSKRESWPLWVLLALAVAVRIPTLGLQSFWYDEAYTPVHVLAPSLITTLHHVARTENTPPLWYILVWALSRVFGTGAVALRSISAVAGVGTVAVGWWIGRELGGRRVAIVLCALCAVNPLLVWYSQEARAYGLFVFLASLAFLWFLRAQRTPSARALIGWAVFSAMALLTHYFAVFLIAPQAVLLLGSMPQRLRRAGLAAFALVGVVAVALVPLISAQGGHGTQWIGHWLLASRLQAIPQYYLTGYSGAPLGRGIELLVLLPILGALPLAWRAQRPALWTCASIGLVAMALPLAMALMGADYLAPRNLVADWVPVTAALAVLFATRREGWLLAAVLVAGWLALVIDVDFSPRLQRGDWSYAAQTLRQGNAARAIVTPELGAAPLEYYIGPLHPAYRRLAVSEIDLVGYPPVRASAALPPVPGFKLFARDVHHAIYVYRFRAVAPHTVTAATLRRRVITADSTPEVLVP